MSLPVARYTGFDVQISFQYPWFTPPASIPETQAANDASFATPTQYGDVGETDLALDANQLCTQNLTDFAVDGFDGLAAWRRFCAAGTSPKSASIWMQSVGRLKRIFPITFASLLSRAECGTRRRLGSHTRQELTW